MRQRIGYRVPVGTPKQREQAIAHCGKHLCGVALRRMPGIFAKRGIPHVMNWVLNCPMPAPQPLDRRRSRLRWRHTDQPITHRTAAFAGLEYDPFAFPPHDLLHIRPIQSSICALPQIKRRVSKRPCPFSVRGPTVSQTS